LPLHHVYPFVVGMLVPLAMGLPLVLPSAFTGSQVLQALQEGRATVMMGVPRLYEAMIAGLDARLAQRGRIPQAILGRVIRASVWSRRRLRLRLGRVLLSPLRRRIAPDLRMVVSGGAALSPATGWRLEGLGWLVATGYGLTETAPLLAINRPGNLRFQTAGQPIPGVELRIDLQAAPEGDGEGTTDRVALGEVLARGPGIFGGYLNLPEKTAEAFTGDGWFRTGDLGFIDADGFLHLAGRRSTMIVTASGKNVQPETIEDAYLKHPAIGEIAVFERDGKIAGLIVPHSGPDGSAAEEDVRRAVGDISQHLPSYQRLASYALTRETIPRTRLGKPRRHLLVALHDEALRSGPGAAPAHKGPMPLEEMSADDRALLEDPAAREGWDWLASRYPDRRLTPDSDIGSDLGVDSMEWLNISLELSQRTGIHLSEAAITRVRTVRDLLSEVAGGEGAAAAFSLDHPEAVLDERHARWLQPLGPVSRAISRAIYRVNRWIMRGLFRLEATGLDHVPGQGPFVIAPTHGSLLDPAVVAAALEPDLLQRTYWAGWTGIVFADPIRRRFARILQAVPIDPERGAASSLALGGAVLKRGNALIWFPEGRRSNDGCLQPLMPGLGMLLEHFAVPVVPVVIRGAYEAWPRRHWLPRFRPVSVQFLPPLDPAPLAQEGDSAPQRIMEALQVRLAQAIEPARPVSG
jgi:long-chain acyl-CoA synthetase